MSITFKGGRTAAFALALAIAAIPGAAEAGSKTRTAVGVGLAAGAVGLALGAAAANAEPVEEEVVEERVYRRPRCWTERRSYEDRYGDIHIRRVRVCD
jgi:hypothetical protein